MAIVNFGATSRGTVATNTSYGIGIKNTTTSTLIIGLLHGVGIAPGAVRYITFNDLDDRLRFNPRNENVDVVSSDGKKPYLDGVNEFAKLVANGTLLVYLATQNVSANTFTQGTTAVYTTYGDGSVIFS